MGQEEQEQEHQSQDRECPHLLSKDINQIHNSELSYMESLALMAHYKCSSPLWVYIYNIHTGPFYSNKGTGLMRIYKCMYVSWFLYKMVAQNMLRTHDIK